MKDQTLPPPNQLLDNQPQEPDKPESHLIPEKPDEGPACWQDVQLTDTEIERALNDVKIDKFKVIEQERLDLQRRRIEVELRQPWTSKQLYEQVLYWARTIYRYKRPIPGTDLMEPGLQVDEFNKHAIRALCYYFSNEREAFVEYGRNNPDAFGDNGASWDPDKGLCLLGPWGTGKTALMRAFQKNKRRCYMPINARMIADMYSEAGKGGASVIKKFSILQPIPIASVDYFFQREIGLCLEDVGTDTEALHMGNRKNVIGEILLNRYDAYQDYPNFTRDCTHMTSNLTMDQMEKKYGPRVRDRTREMFNVMVVDGPSRRR